MLNSILNDLTNKSIMTEEKIIGKCNSCNNAFGACNCKIKTPSLPTDVSKESEKIDMKTSSVERINTLPTDEETERLALIVKKIFYSPATNEQAEGSIQNGIQLIQDYIQQISDKKEKEIKALTDLFDGHDPKEFMRLVKRHSSFEMILENMLLQKQLQS